MLSGILSAQEMVKESCLMTGEPAPSEIKLNKKQTLISLAHEMVHVKQFARGELKDYLRIDAVKWKNKTYNLSKVKYWSCPWEKEAHKKDKILYESFKQRNK